MDLPHRPFGLAAQDWLVPAPAKIVVTSADGESKGGGEEGRGMSEHLQEEETRPCLNRIDENKETRNRPTTDHQRSSTTDINFRHTKTTRPTSAIRPIECCQRTTRPTSAITGSGLSDRQSAYRRPPDHQSATRGSPDQRALPEDYQTNRTLPEDYQTDRALTEDSQTNRVLSEDYQTNRVLPDQLPDQQSTIRGLQDQQSAARLHSQRTTRPTEYYQRTIRPTERCQTTQPEDYQTNRVLSENYAYKTNRVLSEDYQTNRVLSEGYQTDSVLSYEQSAIRGPTQLFCCQRERRHIQQEHGHYTDLDPNGFRTGDDWPD